MASHYYYYDINIVCKKVCYNEWEVFIYFIRYGLVFQRCIAEFFFVDPSMFHFLHNSVTVCVYVHPSHETMLEKCSIEAKSHNGIASICTVTIALNIIRRILFYRVPCFVFVL